MKLVSLIKTHNNIINKLYNIIILKYNNNYNERSNKFIILYTIYK